MARNLKQTLNKWSFRIIVSANTVSMCRLSCDVVIGKAPTHFFNCASSRPWQVGLFLLLSPGSDEPFFSIVGMPHTRNLRNGPVQYIS